MQQDDFASLNTREAHHCGDVAEIVDFALDVQLPADTHALLLWSALQVCTAWCATISAVQSRNPSFWVIRACGM